MYDIPTIKGCTDEQATFIRLELDHLESNPGDPYGNTFRFVYRAGRKSQWCSRIWGNLNWDQVKPREVSGC